MHHPEQPALPRVGDDGSRRERAAHGHADVAGLPDLLVDIVWNRLVVEQTLDRAADRLAAEDIELVAAGAEAAAAKQVLDLAIERQGHFTPDAGSSGRSR